MLGLGSIAGFRIADLFKLQACHHLESLSCIKHLQVVILVHPGHIKRMVLVCKVPDLFEYLQNILGTAGIEQFKVQYQMCTFSGMLNVTLQPVDDRFV